MNKFILILFCLVGCTPIDPTWYVANSDEAELLTEAISRWDYPAKVVIDPTQAAKSIDPVANGNFLLFVDPGFAILDHEMCFTDNGLNINYEKSNYILICNTFSNEKKTILITHEFGHYLGLTNSNNINDIMYEFENWDISHPTEEEKNGY